MTNASPTSTEIRRRKHSSDGGGGSFSFPSTTPIDEESSSSSHSSFSDDFEFGSCLTSDSHYSDGGKSSPADHLFFNGRLLPHPFPFHPPPPRSLLTANAPSRTSSIGSKDSLLSSRSNSTSSTSSSARTSSSDASERRLLLYARHGIITKSAAAAPAAGKAVSAQVYGSSQRWQFMAPVPALSRETSRRRKPAAEEEEKEPRRGSPIMKKKKMTKTKKKAVVKRSRTRRFGRRLFRWFVSACKQCHAIEPSRKDQILRNNVNLR